VRRPPHHGPSRAERLLRVAGAAAFLAIAPCTASPAESFAIVAVGELPQGPDADLAELAHQLRAACRDRVGNVLDVPTMQARLRGQTDGATLSELDRAYGGALAVYQNGEFESALRTLRAIVEDIEALPEGREPYQQWIRATLRLAHAAATIGRNEEADAVLIRLLRIEPGFRADPDQYSPTYRRRMDDLRVRVRGMAQRRVTIVANGRAGSLFVDGRPSGTTPMTLFLPAGRYRIGGVSGALRVPSFQVDLTEEDRTVVLDFETAEAIRLTAGPGLALSTARRAEGLIRAGAWLDVDRLIVAARAFEGDAPFLVGSIYDVRRGALLREGSVRTVAGGVPSANIGALAAFLLTGAQQREVKARTPDAVVAAPRPDVARAAAEVPPTLSPRPSAEVAGGAPAAASAPRPVDPPATTRGSTVPAAVEPPPADAAAPPDLRPREALAARPTPPPDLLPVARPGQGAWKRPAAWVAGGLAVGLAGLAVNRRLAANDAYADAGELLGPDGALLSSSYGDRYRDLVRDGDAAARATWISAGASVAFAVVAGWLGGWPASPAGTSSSTGR
jgi:hypothetical protein